MEGLENKYKATEQENLTLKLELTKLSEKVDFMKDEYSNRLQEAEFKWDIIACLVKEYSELRKRTLGISESQDGNDNKYVHNMPEQDIPSIKTI